MVRPIDARVPLNMKVILCEPPVPAGSPTPERLYGCSYELYHFPDLANLYCAAVLETAGIEVTIIDSNLQGLGPRAFEERLRQERADAVIIHSVILSKSIDLSWLHRIAEILPEALILFHGPEPTRVPEEYLLHNHVRVIRGEPEGVLIDVLEGGRPPGISMKSGNGFTHVPVDPNPLDLDTLPFPYRNHPDIAPFASQLFNPKFESGPFTSMMASRGCSFRCLFCVPNSISYARELEYLRAFGKKPKVAVASAPTVIREFELLSEQGYRSVSIIDDQFLWNKKRTLEICNGVKDLGIEWGILSRADFLDDETIVCALREAGCTSVDIGVESLIQDILDDINKDLDVATIEKAVQACNKCNLTPKFNILIGASPQETVQDVRDTVKTLRRMGAERVMFSIATPFKGTKFYEHCEASGYLVDSSDQIDPISKSMISYPPPGMTKKQLEREVKRAYRSFYLHPSTILRRMKSIRSMGELVNNLKVAWRLLIPS